MNRALRAAAMGALLFSPVALSACSTGQVAQTAEQVRDKAGGQANAGNIAIRQAHLAYPVNGEYHEGSDARFIVAIANDGQTDDTLLSITSDAFDGAEVTGSDEIASDSSGGGLDVPIPPDSNVYIGGDGPVVTLTGLNQALTPGQTVDVTMTFAEAGDVPVMVLVGVSTRDLPRGEPFDFSEQEAGGSGGGSGG